MEDAAKRRSPRLGLLLRRMGLCCAIVGLIAPDSSASARLRTKVLLIKLTFAESRTANTATGGDADCEAREFPLQSIARAAPDGNLLWNTRVPNGFSPRPLECNISRWVKDWHEPDQRGYDYNNLGLRFAAAPDRLIFAADGALFGLDSDDGEVKFEWVARKISPDFYYFDGGKFEVHHDGTLVCTGNTFAAAFLAVCDNRIFFFDGKVAVALAASSGNLIAEAAWEPRFRSRGATVTRDSARIPLGPYILVLKGVTFVR